MNIMNKTPNANRINIAIFGKRNSGKSSLLNALTDQEISLVSAVKGTTTDPVKKTMELIPLGPVLFIDTAGLDDEGELGELRVQKSLKILERTDFAIYVLAANDLDEKSFQTAKHLFKRFHIPYLAVINKIDYLSEKRLQEIKTLYPNCLFISATEKINLTQLKEELIKRIKDDSTDPPIVGDLISYNGTVILVVPIDSGAPKGRLILPQIQVIRDCLDHGIKSYVVRDTELKSALNNLKNVDLVITDSQAFKKVAKIVPPEIKLTSFSILFARYKGNLKEFLTGIRQLENLPDQARILISESCTHNVSCEDIGRIKIPSLIRKYTGKKIDFEVKGGHDFPPNLNKYNLIIHCGACMLNRKEMQTRLLFCREKRIPITNYGMVLAYFNGILDRTMEIFNLT